MPSSWLSHSAPVKARSVPPSRSTWYCSRESSARHSASVLVISVVMPKGYDGTAAKPYAAITTLRAITPLAAPARRWTRTGLGLPAAWLAIAVLLAAQAELTPDGLAAIGLLVAVVGLRLAAAACERVARAAELHDVGTMAIPGSILCKPGPLDPAGSGARRSRSPRGSSRSATPTAQCARRARTARCST